MLSLTSSLLRGARSLSTRHFSYASVNGAAATASSLSCSIWDITFQRGDGVFEAVRVVPGKSGEPVPRAVGLHMDRLFRSAAALELPLPPRADMEAWLRKAAKEGGHGGYVRLMATRGGGSPGSPAAYGHHLPDLDAPPRVFCVWQPLAAPREATRLEPVVAPWHPAGFDPGNWATIKWLAYGANVHSTRLAKRAGADDALGAALLLGRGWGVADDAPARARPVLDGPNFAVAWAEGGVLKAPSWRRLGMLESITSRLAWRAARLPRPEEGFLGARRGGCHRLEAAAKIGVPVDEGVHTLADLERADEAWVLSTSADMAPVAAVGGATFASAPDSEMRLALLEAMRALALEMEG